MKEENFIEQFKEALEMEGDQHVKMSDEFKQFEEWDSLARLSLIALLDEEYEVEIESKELEALNSVQDLFDLVNSKKA